jgi:hypothetical protein
MNPAAPVTRIRIIPVPLLGRLYQRRMNRLCSNGITNSKYAPHTPIMRYSRGTVQSGTSVYPAMNPHIDRVTRKRKSRRLYAAAPDTGVAGSRTVVGNRCTE